MRRGGQDQKEGGQSWLFGGEFGEAGERGVEAGTWRWAGKGPEAAGNSQPHPRRSICGVTSGHL